MGLNGCYLMICLYELHEVWGTLLKRAGKLRVLPVSTKCVMMKGSVMLLIAVIIACGGGRPIRYVDYDVMNRGIPIRKSHYYAYADDTKKIFFITGVPQATQGSPVEQTTGPVSDASLIPLTGEIETRIPRSYPSSPFETPGPWIFTLLLLSCLGVAGVTRACMKGLVRFNPYDTIHKGIIAGESAHC